MSAADKLTILEAIEQLKASTKQILWMQILMHRSTASGPCTVANNCVMIAKLERML